MVSDSSSANPLVVQSSSFKASVYFCFLFQIGKRTVQCDLQSPIIYLALILSSHVDSIVTSVSSVATLIGSGYAPFPIRILLLTAISLPFSN